MDMEKRKEIISVVEKGLESVKPETKDEKEKTIEDFDVLVKIYEITEVKHGKAYFRKIVSEMGVDRNVVSANIDKLFDLGMICGSWDKVNGSWRRTFIVDGDAMGLAEKHYNEQVKEQKEKQKEEGLSFGDKKD